MNIVVQSRFACLKNEDEEDTTKIRTRTAPKDSTKRNQQKEKDKKPANMNSKQTVKKQKAAKVATAKQWEEWKQKDEKLVTGNFEQDLENALILSKIHYEENKDKYIAPEGKAKKNDKKKTTKKTISLDQFLAGDKEPEQTNCDQVELIEKESKENFFAKMSEDAKTALTKEKLKDEFRERQIVIDKVITAAQYQEKLQVEQKKNEELRKELEKSQKEIASVKERNKTLYTLLSTGEMKGKAEIITELEKLTVIKDELTQEVTRLYGLLEQERSKVAALSNDKQLHKKSGKKH